MHNQFIGEYRTFKAGRFTVRAKCYYDYVEDMSWDETGEVTAKLQTGEYVCFMTVVTVYLDERELASEYLSGSIYADPAEFFKEHIGARGMYGSYFRDMVRTVCQAARREVTRLRTTLPHVRDT